MLTIVRQGPPGSWLQSALLLLLHLRLPFQLVLSPVFLLGWALSGAPVGPVLLAAFLLLHICVYGGATAYNTFYDRDRGPIGTMRSPPLPGGWEREGGLALQLAGVAGLAWLQPWVGAVGLGLVAAGTAYSHPSLRWKARPDLSLAVVAAGQGAAPMWMGWQMGMSLATGPGPGAGTGWAAIAAGATVLAGVYPLTQVYQIEEDRARGDRTFAVFRGPVACFRWAKWVVPVGIAGLSAALAAGTGHLAWLGTGVLAAGIPPVISWWEKGFACQTPVQAHDWSIALLASCAGILALGAAVEIAL